MINKVVLVCILCFLGSTYVSSVPKGNQIKIEKVAEPAELAEGPHWDVKSQKLYYVDLMNAKIILYDPKTGNRTYASLDGKFAGVIVPVEGTTDKLIVGVDRDVVIVTWDGEKNVNNPPIKKLVSLDTNSNDTRVNDGKCDPAGRFWIGTMALEVNGGVTANRGSLYRIGKDGKANNVVSSITISNGLTWSLNNDTMYYIDSPTRQILAFDYNNADGTLSNKRVIFDLNKTENEIDASVEPDGMTNDADGNLWIALFNGKAIIQVDPKKGKLLRKIELPVDKITSVAFGGPQFEDLYVTSARTSMTIEEKQEKPDSGALYRITGLGVNGLPPHSCKYEI